jgi:thiol-disulfide isomerase/thioredoxin
MTFIGCDENKRPISGEIRSLSLKTYHGETLKLDTNDSQVTLLVFWATWCQPCLMEIPALVKLQDKFKAQNFRVLAINMDDAEGDKVKAIAQEMGINYPLLIGSEDIAQQFGGVDALPTSFLVGKDHKIKEKIVGLHAYEDLEILIQNTLRDSI